jgi:hypothetical protein
MTLFYAAVKYAVDDSPAQKRRQLEDGIGFVVGLLMDEHGVSAEDIQSLLEGQIDYAFDVEAQREPAP